MYRGIRYASEAEARRAKQLDLMQRAGEIWAWIRQPEFNLTDDSAVPWKYVADFLVVEPRGPWIWFHVHVEDVKGVETPRFREAKKRWKQYGPFPLRVLRRKGNGWETEVVQGG